MMTNTVNYSIADVRRLPAHEEPFEVPSHWVWTTLNNILPPMETRDPLKLQAHEFLYIDIDAIDNSIQRIRKAKRLPVSEAPSRAKRAVHAGDVIISLVRPYLKNVALIDEKLTDAVASTAFYVCGSSPFYDSKFLYEYLRSPFMTKYLMAHTKGDNAPSVRNEDFLKSPIPLPPLDEQKRIVERIESLLGKIGLAKQHMSCVVASSIGRRRNVIASAVAGGLTEKWRLNNPVEETEVDIPQTFTPSSKTEEGFYGPIKLPESWRWARFSDIADVESNLVDPKNYGDYPHIAPDNIEKETGKLLDFVTIDAAGVTSPKHLFKPGHILYSKIRPYLSKVVLVDFEGLCSADMYPVKARIEPRFLHLYMLSSLFLNFANNSGSRTVLPKINQKALARIPVPVPPLSEQCEIVKMVNTVLSKETVVDDVLDSIESQMTSLDEVVLQRAFQGQL